VWFHGQSHVGVLFQGMMIVNTTIHEKKAALWQKGQAGEQLRATI